MKTFQILFISILVASSFNLYAATEADMKAECKIYATEENIPADELDAYIIECINSIKDAEEVPEDKN